MLVVFGATPGGTALGATAVGTGKPPPGGAVLVVFGATAGGTALVGAIPVGTGKPPPGGAAGAAAAGGAARSAGGGTSAGGRGLAVWTTCAWRAGPSNVICMPGYAPGGTVTAIV